MSVEPVARKIILKIDVGKAQVGISNLNVLELKTHRITIRTRRYKNRNITQHRLALSPHPKRTTQKTSFATTSTQQSSISPTTCQILSTNGSGPRYQQHLRYPSDVWQQQMEKVTFITYSNTHLYQKPNPVWEPDHTTNFTTQFKPIPRIDDYNPTYIDLDYGRDSHWDTETYNQNLIANCVAITKDGQPDCIPLSTYINLKCKNPCCVSQWALGN